MLTVKLSIHDKEDAHSKHAMTPEQVEEAKIQNHADPLQGKKRWLYVLLGGGGGGKNQTVYKLFVMRAYKEKNIQEKKKNRHILGSMVDENSCCKMPSVKYYSSYSSSMNGCWEHLFRFSSVCNMYCQKLHLETSTLVLEVY